MMWAAIAAVLFVGAGAWWWRARKRAKAAAETRLYSIVLLLRSPKPLNAEILAHHASAVLGETVGAGASDDGPCVIGQAPHFILLRSGQPFLIHSIPARYSDGAAEGVKDLRIRHALEEHTAWLSVDILHGENATPESWQIVGRMLARLIGPECIGLYDALEGRFAAYGEETAAQLASEDPRTAVFGRSDYVPVVEVSNEAGLAEAKRVAQERWPEFVEAFGSGDGEAFSVKVPITVEEVTEHIWVDVSAIAGDSVQGALGNDPVQLAGMRLGSPVTVPVEDVEDWVIMRKGGFVGGFSVSAVMGG